MSGEPILIVDDNAINLKLVKVVLENAGFLVKTAMDGEKAITILETFQPRLILMDLQLPGIDGLTATQRIKADPRTAHIIVVALTAYAMKGDEARAREAGCDGYITKPIDTRGLPATINDLLKKT